MYHIIMLYTLNIHNAIGQLYFNKAEKKYLKRLKVYRVAADSSQIFMGQLT